MNILYVGILFFVLGSLFIAAAKCIDRYQISYCFDGNVYGKYDSTVTAFELVGIVLVMAGLIMILASYSL